MAEKENVHFQFQGPWPQQPNLWMLTTNGMIWPGPLYPPPPLPTVGQIAWLFRNYDPAIVLGSYYPRFSPNSPEALRVLRILATIADLPVDANGVKEMLARTDPESIWQKIIPAEEPR